MRTILNTRGGYPRPLIEQKAPIKSLEHFGKLGMHWGVITEKDSAGGKGKRLEVIPEKKSAHRIALEAGKIAKGYTPEEAEQFAAKRIKGEKIALGILATGIAVAGVYAGHQAYGKYFCGVSLEAGKEFHYVNALGDNATFDRRLYTTFRKDDQDIYKGLFVQGHLKGKAAQMDPIGAALGKLNFKAFDTVLTSTEGIKAPSQHEAAKLYKEFVRSKPGGDMLKVGVKDYLTLNQNIVVDTPESKAFIGFLQKKGYNAVLDANDQFFSGFNAKKPLIILNANSSLVKTGQSIIDDQLSNKLYIKEMTKVAIREGSKAAVGLGLGIVAISEVGKVGRMNRVDSLLKGGKYKGYTKQQLFSAMTENGTIDTKKLNAVVKRGETRAATGK